MKREEIIEKVVESMAVLGFDKNGDGGPVTEKTSLGETGMDSLDSIELVMALEKCLIVDLYKESYTGDTTVGELADMIKRNGPWN